MDPDSVTELRRIIGRLARQLHASSTREGLTPTEASALGMVATRGPLSLGELTELEGLNPTMLSRVVRKLDSLGLVTRLRNPDDLRAARAEVTPAGLEVHEHITNERNAVVSRCVSLLSPEDAAAIAAALPALEALAEELRASVIVSQ